LPGVQVSDVFISYARADQAIACSLADDLKAQGYSVWWDTELLAADDFNDEIRAALSKAGAVIVIWTKASINSRFVRDEARFALDQQKLISTKTADVYLHQLPFGFQGQHTENVFHRDQIVRAIEKLRIKTHPSVGVGQFAKASKEVRYEFVTAPSALYKHSKAEAYVNRSNRITRTFAKWRQGILIGLQPGGAFLLFLVCVGISEDFALTERNMWVLTSFLWAIWCIVGWHICRSLLFRRAYVDALLATVQNGLLLIITIGAASAGLDITLSTYAIIVSTGLLIVVYSWAFWRAWQKS
jgi:TIR domain